MIFSQTFSLRELERIMRGIPNFAPRGHGTYILCRHTYTAKDCDCNLCPHYTGRGKKKRCSLEQCACLKERIEAGVATYREIITATMSVVDYHPLKRRVADYLKESEECPMNYRNEKHRAAFREAIRRKDKKDYALMAALYLLTADHRLWQTAKRYTEKNIIDFDRIRLKGSTPTEYTLYCCAKDLYCGTKHLSIADLSDTALIPTKQFGIICNAMAVRRFGIGAIDNERNRAKD